MMTHRASIPFVRLGRRENPAARIIAVEGRGKT
jgi:hypothetical protein